MPSCSNCKRTDVEFASFKYGKVKKQCVRCNEKSAAKRREWKKTPSGAASVSRTEASDGYKEAQKRKVGTAMAKAAQKRYRDSHRDLHKSRFSTWAATNGAKEWRAAKNATPEYRAVRSKRKKERYYSSAEYRFSETLRNRLRSCLRDTEYSATFFKYAVDFKSPEDVGAHILPLAAEKGWSLQNYGNVWHVDHIIACFWYDFADEEDVRRCWRKTNLQPMERLGNMSKGIRLPAVDVLEQLRDCFPKSWMGLPPSAEEVEIARCAHVRVVR